MYVITYILRGIKKTITKLSKLNYDPRHTPPPHNHHILPISFGGKPIIFCIVDGYLWILIGDRNKGTEFKINLDQSSVFPPIRGLGTFTDNYYTFFSTTVSTRSILVVVLVTFLSTIYSMCLAIIAVIDFIFWVLRIAFPLVFLFHFLNKIRLDRAEFIKNKKSTKR